MTRRLAAIALLAAAGCGQGTSPAEAGAPPATPPSTPAFDPDVPAWRGGCFWERAAPGGGPEKIVNGSPGPEVVEYGCACAAACPGPIGAVAGGLVYLDGYDPGTFTGNVTVLPSAPGSRPRVVAPRGGAGVSLPGSPVARLNPSHTRMLALRDVSGSLGTLVLVDLASGAEPQSLALNARIANHEWLTDTAFLYVGNYRPASPTVTSLGDLLWRDLAAGTTRVVAADASRYDFTMYRLSRDKGRVAWLSGVGPAGTGLLSVRELPPGGPATALDDGVAAADFADDGTLVWLAANPDGATYSLKALPAGGGGAALVDGSVSRAAVAGNTLVYVTGYALLSGYGTLKRATTAALDAPETLSAAAAPSFLAVPGALAWTDVTAGSPLEGELRAAPLGSPSFAVVDPGVTPQGGFTVSPGQGFLAYTVGYRELPSPGSPMPQPGVAAELKVAPLSGGAPLLLAREAAALRVAFREDDAYAAGIGRLPAEAAGGFEPAAGAGPLVVTATAPGSAPLALAARVQATGFAFGGDALAFLRAWDDGLARGTLSLAAPPYASAADLDGGVGFFLPPRLGRVVYGIASGPRRGLWLAGP